MASGRIDMAPGVPPAVRVIADVEIAVAPWTWPLSRTRRAEIDAHFAAAQRARPALWNGRVLLSRALRVAGDRLVGEAFEIDFSDFLWWRDSGFPDPDLRNVFAMAALRGADGGFVLARMGAQTANAGRVYFPAGTPDRDDIVAGRIDFAGSVARELAEETGLSAGAFAAAPGWTAVFDGARLALMRVLTAAEPAADLVARIEAFIAAEPRPELAGALAVHALADLPEPAPAFMRAFLATRLPATRPPR